MEIHAQYLATLLLGGLTLPAFAAVSAPQPPLPAAAELITQLGLVEANSPVREMPGWRPPRKVVVTGNVTAVAELQAAAPGAVFVVVRNARNPEVDVSDADVIIGSCAAELLARAPQVRWVQSMGVGVEQCVAVPALKERQLLLTNMQRADAAEIAEHAIALSLALARNLKAHLISQLQGNWNPGNAQAMNTLNGKTLLVVGLGGIGTEVARRAHALGMKVTATRASGRTGPDFVSHVGLADELLTLAKSADIIVNAAPLTPATTHLFNAGFFAVLKPSAYFVNVARGRSVVTADLLAALTERRLAGAALDVTDPEPLPADHPLWRAPNVIITPHVASSSTGPRDILLAIARENLRRYTAGEKMLSVVDVARGY